jgi:hypothetical protein
MDAELLARRCAELEQLQRRCIELEQLRAEAEQRLKAWRRVETSVRLAYRVRSSRQAAGIFHRRQCIPARRLRPTACRRRRAARSGRSARCRSPGRPGADDDPEPELAARRREAA